MGMNEGNVTRIAIVGAGYMAGEHARAFESIPGVEIVGICGRSRDRAAALAERHKTSVHDDVASLYAATQADGIVIAVNELSAREICLAAFAFPWACLIEKPAGLDLAEAQAIEAAAAAAGRRAFVALNRRSYASTRAALAALDPAGPPRLVSVLDQQDMQAARDFGQPEEVVRNYMYANAIHLIDYFSVFCRGNPVIDSAAGWDSDAPRHVVSTLRYDSGDTGVYQAVWDGPGPWAVSVTDAAARFEMRPLESLTVQRRGQRQAVPVELGNVDSDYKPGLRVQAESFVNALRGRETDLATLADSTRSMEICARIYGLI